ncbi:MAG: Crp/Fnr family transcriptional regulator, partial [Spirochaetota bacterium]|nr:Crp/Fnr family transcriptional regulator [Spirochaetota bacterium]
MAKIKIFDAMAGCKLIQCGDEVILAGIPPEVIKAIKLKNLPFPTALLIPDKLIIANNLQNSTEFPLYHFLFFCDGIKNKKKLKILGHSQHVKNNRELLRLTLFGPRADELLKIGIEESLIEMFQKELQFFQKENNSNSLLDISNYLEEYIFDGENKIFFENISISRIGFNKYVFEYDNEKVEINLNTTEEQLPPYYVQIDCTPNELCKFGIEILGGATGFSASSASSGLVFVYNGNYILIDSIPFIDYHLVARGVAKSQIKSMFLSHIHDDHCNLLSLMFGVNKIKIITTKEIYWMAMYKMSLMLNLPMQEVMMYFDLVPLTVGKTLDYYGFKIKPHYTVHTIPTIGATFSIRHNNLIYSTVITGDNQNLSDLQKMLDENIITQDRAGKIKELYLKETDLLIADGGEGLIHGTPRDALLSQANRVVFFHLDALPPEFNSTFS